MFVQIIIHPKDFDPIVLEPLENTSVDTELTRLATSILKHGVAKVTTQHGTSIAIPQAVMQSSIFEVFEVKTRTERDQESKFETPDNVVDFKLDEDFNDR